jgi:hypothetical protein
MSINRRDFLKLSSMVSAVGVLSAGPIGNVANLPVEAAASGKIYKGTRDGKVFVSPNGGKTWKLHSSFGKTLPVLDLFTRNKQLYAHLGYKHASFHLSLAKDGKTWLSMPFNPIPKA